MQGLTGADSHAVMNESLVRGCKFSTQNLVASVSLVGKERMAQMSHVGTYLMGSPCLQSAFHQCNGSKAFQYVVVSDGWLANLAVNGVDGHLQTVLRVTSYVAFYDAVVFLERSPHQCIVLAFGGVVEELLAKVRLGLCCLGYYQQAAGILVYAMY